MARKLFYVPGHVCALDEVIIRPDGSTVGAWSGLTADELARQHPGATIVDANEAADAIRTAACTDAREITEEAFQQALGCLPPVQWARRGDTESFFLSELYTLDVGSAYVRIGTRHYTLRQPVRTSHEALVASVERVRDPHNVVTQ